MTNANDAATYRARAEECERLADQPGYERQRALLIDIATKWRQLAAQVERSDKAGKDNKDGDRRR